MIRDKYNYNYSNYLKEAPQKKNKKKKTFILYYRICLYDKNFSVEITYVKDINLLDIYIYIFFFVGLGREGGGELVWEVVENFVAFIPIFSIFK